MSEPGFESTVDLDDRAFEVLLSEAAGGPSPPDLRRRILSRLAEEQKVECDGDVRLVVHPNSVRKASPGSRTDRRRAVVIASVVSVVAATLLAIVMVRSLSRTGPRLASEVRQTPEVRGKFDGRQTFDGRGGAEVDRSVRLEPLSPRAAADGLDAGQEPADATVTPVRPVELPIASAKPNRGPKRRSKRRSSGSAVQSPPTIDPTIDPTGDPVDHRKGDRSIALVSRRIEQRWRGLLSNKGIQPAGDVPVEVWRDRLADLFGTTVSDSVVDAESLSRWIGDHPSVVADAYRESLHVAAAGPLADALGELFTGEPVDHTIAGWIADSDHPMFGQLVEHVGLVGRWTLDADLACVRCHNDLVDGSSNRVSQRDYWSLAALLRTDDRPTFFETRDARTLLAAPRVAGRLLDGRGGDDGSTGGQRALKSRTEFAGAIVGSTRLARSLARSLVAMLPWEAANDWASVVTKSPVTKSPVTKSPVTGAPVTRSLVDEVAADLVDHRFDLPRALAIVLDGPGMHRAVVSDELVVSGDGLPKASAQLSLMAAYPRAIRRGERLAHWRQHGGATLSGFDSTLLAQVHVAENDSAPVDLPAIRRSPMEDFPTASNGTLDDASSAWLAQIGDVEIQRMHLAMVVGRPGLPAAVVRADGVMRQQGIADQLRVRRLRWLLR